jgi:tetratricopeptide (TPR) repeat protein
MTESELKSGYREIAQRLSEKKLKKAFSLIRKGALTTGQASFTDQLDDLELTYRNMLIYTVKGVEDPERGKIYNNLVVRAFDLADKMFDHLMTKFSHSHLYSKKRSSEPITPDDFMAVLSAFREFSIQQKQWEVSQMEEPDERITRELWQKVIGLFWAILICNKISSDERSTFSVIIKSGDIPEEYRSVLVTALTFSTLRYFDEEKLNLLLFLYMTGDNPQLIRQRCLTGFMLALYQYEERIGFYPKIMAKLTVLSDNPAFCSNAGQIMLQLLGSRETEKITRKIQEEIIPEMIRISPNIRNKLNFESLMDEGNMDDRNPEWTELFKDSPGLLGKMEELTKMQTEGADVFLSSFYALKSFPFFNEFANWFIPFYPDHPEFLQFTPEEYPEKQGISGSLVNAPFLCNSDKYSFLIMLRSISGDARAMMQMVLKEQMEQMEEISKEETLLDPDREARIVSNQYIQDLYRFFRLHPLRSEFDDIFSWRFDFYHKSFFRKMMDSEDDLVKKSAAFYFEKGYYEEALDMYSQFDDQDGEYLQKMAYCHQKLGHFEEALALYRKAELYGTNKIWTLKKIALCCRNLKRPEEALKVYQTLETLDPDNLNTIYALGYCYNETGQYQDALNSFFKIEYLSPGNKKVWKPVAWFSFMTGKTEQAEKYYKKLLEDSPDKYDLMNMGHVQWSQGKRESALVYYRHSLTSGGFSREDFLTAFEEDKPALISRGIQSDEVEMILDQLWYSLEDNT